MAVFVKGKEEETQSVEVREAIVSRNGYSFVATGELFFPVFRAPIQVLYSCYWYFSVQIFGVSSYGC